MRKSILLLLPLLLLGSCKTFRGQFTTHEDITLNTGKKKVTIEVGQREVKINFKSKKKAELEIDGHKVDLKFDSKLKIPSNGDFKVKASDWNQVYDLVGTSKVEVTSGPLSHDFESCVERVPYTVCNGRSCHIVYRDFYGQRHVEYRLRTTTQNIVMNLVAEDHGHAEFSGYNSSSERVYEYYGNCR
ncbi:hypothetical protein [Bacteriovorax sp. Seq25_V]|uniref:hypothetical protein n=1 Tax=Bacteriovorax sp. Seq25_V TaxID=1201288 RepID=UPI00038A24EF|nr:hypothetical protein [Bacteriovorax sp. Seq25_V]EQC44038.1 hypothetical protein M900_1509 [Bacteriovorax sp. Seq25_V]